MADWGPHLHVLAKRGAGLGGMRCDLLRSRVYLHSMKIHGLDGLVSLKGGLRRVVIRKLRTLGIVGFPIPRYDAQTGTWQPQKTSASGKYNFR